MIKKKSLINPVDNVFWIAPGFYLALHHIDPDFPEIWLTRDNMGASFRISSIYPVKNGSVSWDDLITAGLRQSILEKASRHLVMPGEKLIPDGDWFTVV